jgi:hypothetical protein
VIEGFLFNAFVSENLMRLLGPMQIVRFGVPNSPKAGQNPNSTLQSNLLKYVLAVGLDFGKTDVTPESRIGVTPALTTEWNRHVTHFCFPFAILLAHFSCVCNGRTAIRWFSVGLQVGLAFF